MSLFAVFLVILSSFMHAGWNLLARRGGSERIFFKNMLLFIVICGFAPAVASELLANSITVKAWFCAAGSGLFCGMYFFFLARSYESSDFTIAYPVARSLPVLLVAAGDTLRGRPLTPAGLSGVILVAGGCFLVPLESFRGFAKRRYLNKSTFWMLLAAFGTVGYSLLDKIASESVRQGPWTALRYNYFFYFFSFLAYLAFLGIFKTGGSARGRRRMPFACGILSFAAYGLVLWAYQLSEHASYVVAFRQFSIVIGVIFGFFMFREKGIAVRFAGTSILTLGLALIALWGR